MNKERCHYNIRLLLYMFVIITGLNSKVFSQSTNSAALENILSVYIYNFTKFIEWHQNDSDTFKICVWGESDIVNPLEIIAKKETVQGKKIIVDELENLTTINDCNILFIAEDDKIQLNKIIEKIKGKNILLITNSAGFAEQGAGINFLQIDDKIKFEINKTALEKNKIVPNSRLLSLAVQVYE